MEHSEYADDYIQSILTKVKSIAIVGASLNNVRPSFFVAKYLISKDYEVYPVNPGHAGKTLLEKTVYPSLTKIPFQIDMVDIFRNSDAAFEITEEALTLNPLPKVIWMQLGVENIHAAEIAEKHGIKVIMNRCPKIEYGRLSGEISWFGINSRTISSKPPKLSKGFQRLNLQ